MPKKLAIHAIVSGKVQGVCFRASTSYFANQHSITGWVKNLSDGTVELIACGEQDAINPFIEWLYHGPDGAHVKDVNWQEIPWQTHQRFEVTR